MYSFELKTAYEIFNGDMLFSEAFPDANVPLECLSGKDIVFHIPYMVGNKVQAGDVLVEFTFYRSDDSYNGHYPDDVIGSYVVRSKQSGYVFHEFTRLNHTLDDLAKPILVYPSLEQLILEQYPIEYEIKLDDFSSKQYICWNGLGANREKRSILRPYYTKYFIIDMATSIELTIDNGQPVFVLNYDNSKIKIQRSDTISFKFADNKVIDFPVLNRPFRAGSYRSCYSVKIPLRMQDIEHFSNIGWEKLRIKSFDGSRDYVLTNIRPQLLQPRDSNEEFSQTFFKIYTRQYIQALSNMGVNCDKTHSGSMKSIDDLATKQEEPCYVYLMVDISNGFHKIGISSHPEYREKTLQSEKPTIEKICAKQHPSRIIAQSIENALHTAFSAKRIRGEWFNLTKEDIAQIIQTLS